MIYQFGVTASTTDSKPVSQGSNPWTGAIVSKRLSLFWGDLPRHNSGPNVGRMDRNQIAKHYGFTVKEIYKAYLNWQDIFRFEGSNLLFKEYLDKLQESNLRPSLIGNRPGQYNLSRYGDSGVYNNANCRFITREENLTEQAH